jgi:Tfp pilus assembly protein FimT
MVVVVLLAVGAMVTVWGVKLILPNLRLKSAVRDLWEDLQMARLTAIRKNVNIVSAFSRDSHSYTIYIDDGGGDPAMAQNYIRDKGETIIKTVHLHPQIRIICANFGRTTGRFAFNGRGIPAGPAGGICLENSVHRYRKVAVSRIGKITIKTSEDGTQWH